MNSPSRTRVKDDTLSADRSMSYHERLLISSPSAQDNSSSDTTTATASALADEFSSIATVRLEAFSEWKENGWVNPFFDLLLKHPLIGKVHMSIASQATQSFPREPSDQTLDHIPLLSSFPLERQKLQQRIPHSSPQGFFLSVEPKTNGVSLKETLQSSPQQQTDIMAGAVNSVLEDLIQSRLLTTPLSGATWDVRNQKHYHQRRPHGEEALSHSQVVYEIFLPLKGAGWSSDALQQAFDKTIPSLCASTRGDSGTARSFFGWSPLQWSNFLVGNLGDIKQDINGQIPIRNQMWWTWTTNDTNVRTFNFGIEYQADIRRSPSFSWKDWLPNAFVSPYSYCQIATRTMFETKGLELVPMDNDLNENKEVTRKEIPITPLTYPYRAQVDQVLRRHHTNHGRFESWIVIESLVTEEMELKCELFYRQVLPKFITPAWRTLSIAANLKEVDLTSFIVPSVEWIPEDQSSILYLHSIIDTQDGQGHRMEQFPSNIVLSFEYEPTFLTLDDFPGDPNRGRELPPAHLYIDCQKQETKSQPGYLPLSPVSVYSNTLIVLPPVPDLSMPFNVISLTSSLYAYIVGTLITILVRKASEKIKFKLYPHKKPESKFQKLKKRMKESLSRFSLGIRKSKETDEKDENGSTSDEEPSTGNVKPSDVIVTCKEDEPGSADSINSG